MVTGKADAPDGAADKDSAVFRATIRPHRSLGRNGFRVMMVVVGLVAGVAALRALFLGFWPVGGFLLLDVVGLYIAFRVNYARGRAMEEVVLTRLELLFRRVSHRGQRREWRFNPLWTRLERQDHAEFGIERLSLVSRGQAVAIAGDLSPDERAHFADEFGRALADVKRGF